MRLLLVSFIFSALLGSCASKPGIYQVPPELIDNFISELHPRSVEELLKSFDYLPGSPDEMDLVILKEVYNGLKNESNSELLTDVFLETMRLSIQQKNLTEVEAELEDHFSNLTATQFNETKAAIHNVFRNALFKLFENEVDMQTMFVDATTFMNRLFKASPAQGVEGEILRKIFEVLTENKGNVEETLRDLLCAKTKEYACEDATECAASLVSSRGKSVDCVIPAIVTSNFNQQVISRVPPIASHSTKLNTLLNMLIVYRSDLEKAMMTQDNSVKPHVRNFLDETFPKVVETVLKKSSFEAALTDVPKIEVGDCQINVTDVVECYAKMHARTIFEKELAKILLDAAAFEELTNILYEGNLTDVEKLPIVLKNVERMYKEANMENHRDWKETFGQIEKLRENESNQTTDCDLKRHIRKIYFLLNFVDSRVISNQFKADKAICLGTVVITPSPEEQGSSIVCSQTLGNVSDIINDAEKSPREKIHEIEALWETTDTPHYTAMVNIIYARDLCISDYVANDLNPLVSNYIQNMAAFLSKSCKYERRYENGTTEISVLNEDEFPQDAWNHSLHEIYKIEELVKDRIYLASNESEPLHRMFEIAQKKATKPSQRIDEIVSRIYRNGPSDFEDVSNYSIYLVLVNDFYDEIGQEFSEETAESVLKHLEIVLAGNYRRDYGVPIDYERFGKVFDFIADRQKYKEQLEVVIPCLDRNLFGIGITQDIVAATREFVARFNAKQIENILQSTQRVDPKCKYTSTTFENRPRPNCTEATTESGITKETSTGYTNGWTSSGGRKGAGTTSGDSTTQWTTGGTGEGTLHTTSGYEHGTATTDDSSYQTTTPDWTTSSSYSTSDATYYPTTGGASDGRTSSRTTPSDWRTTGHQGFSATTDDTTYYPTTGGPSDGRTSSRTTPSEWRTTGHQGSRTTPSDWRTTGHQGSRTTPSDWRTTGHQGSRTTPSDWRTTGHQIFSATTDDTTYYTTTNDRTSSGDYSTTSGTTSGTTGYPGFTATTDDSTYYTTTDSNVNRRASTGGGHTATTNGRTSWTTSDDYHTTDRSSTGHSGGWPSTDGSTEWTTTTDWVDNYTSTGTPPTTRPSTGFWPTSTEYSTTDGSWSVRSTSEDRGFETTTPTAPFWTSDPWKTTTNPGPGASFGPNQCLCADSLQMVLDKMNFCNAKPDVRVIEIKWPENQRQKRSTGQRTRMVTEALAHEIFGVKKRSFEEEN